MSARAIKSQGESFLWEDYLFIEEKKEGYHLYDIADLSNIIAMGFWQIPLSRSLRFTKEVIFADNLHFLLSINASTMPNLELLDRKLIFDPDPFSVFPEHYKGYFECFDSERGYVEKWVDNASLSKDLLCYKR